MTRSKTDQYLTPLEREALGYLTNIGLKGCGECLKVKRADCFGDDGVCLWCRGEATPELTARLEADKALLKRLRRKIDRLQKKNRPNLVKRTQPDPEDMPDD